MSAEFTHEIILPSQGLLNPELPGGKVTQRCMMVQDQKFLSGSKQSAGSALHELIQRTITAPAEFDVSKLSLPDTLYLLFKLRVLSYGDTYRFRTKCPECGKKIDVTVNLAELPVEILGEDYAEDLVVELPHRGDTVYIKLQTNQDNDDINNEIKRRKKRSSEDDSAYILRIARSIEKIVFKEPIDGKKEITNSIEIERYISSLTDLDASTIISTRDNLSYGIVPSIEYICPECSEYIDVNIQFTGEFFRPYVGR